MYLYWGGSLHMQPCVVATARIILTRKSGILQRQSDNKIYYANAVAAFARILQHAIQTDLASDTP